MHPISTVEEKAFQDIFKLINPHYQVPGRSKLIDLLRKKASERKEQLIKWTKSAQYPSYAVDLWKSATTKDYYIALSIHWIDKDWNLNCPVIAFRKVIGDHTAESIGAICANILQEFLGTNPFSGVADGGEIDSVSVTVQLLNCVIEERRCVCHLLNNAVKDLICNNFSNNSWIDDLRRFIGHINHSNPFKEAWDSACLEYLEKL